MTTCIIAEKPSVARDIAHIVGAKSKQEGYMEGSGYVVTWAMGHLIALAMPETYGFSAYKAEDLPIRPILSGSSCAKCAGTRICIRSFCIEATQSDTLLL